MRRVKMLVVAAALAAAGLVASCGGGGSAAPVVDPPTFVADPGQQSLSSVLAGFDLADRGGDGGGSDGGASGGAGDGGSIKRATVVLTCADGTTKTSQTNDVGAYFVGFGVAVCKAPYLVKVIDVGGNTYASVGVDQPDVGKVVNINVTPLSDKVVSDVLLPGIKGTAQTFVPGSLTLANLAEAKANLLTSIRDALTAAGIVSTTGFDPIKSTYAFDGRGVDAVLESISATRNPQTGATELRAKLVSVGSDSVATTQLITAAAPLQTAQVNAPTSPGLNFAKLDNFMKEFNYCLALSPGGPGNDPRCGNKLVSNTYLNGSRDFGEDFKTLLSNGTNAFDAGHVQGSIFRNATVLFTGKYANSTVSYDDLTVVEFTIRQPSVGNAYGAAYASPIEYTRIAVFKRDDAMVGSAAGNWILYGNQRNYDFSIEARYDKLTQVNSARATNIAPTGGTASFSVYANANGTTVVSTVANVTPSISLTVTQTSGTFTGTAFNFTNINQPSYYRTGVRLFFNPYKFDAATRTYVSANIRAAKVTGPGLPSIGVILVANSNSICGGDTFLGISRYNAIPNGTGTVSLTAGGNNTYDLAAVLQSDLVTEPYWYSIPNASRATPGVTDFSGFGAYNLYRADIQLADGSIVTEYGRNLAPVVPPAALASLPWNDPAPSIAGRVDAIGIGSAFPDFNVQWTNNPLAAYVEAANVRTGAFRAVGGTVAGGQYVWDQTRGVFAASSLSSRPTSQTTGYPTSPTCIPTSGGQYPELQNAADFRTLTIRAFQGRARTYNSVQWAN